MQYSAIVGINWGDEGKGRMVDLLTAEYDCVVRYQGGGNAGHTVVNDHGKFALHLIPSGIFRDGVVNILGNGVALDPENLWQEIETLRLAGVKITPDNLMISDRASLLMPWHRLQDELEELRLRDKKYGSTKQGIAPFYADKYQKKTLLAGELNYPDSLREHLKEILGWKNLTLTGVYGAEPVREEQIKAWIEEYGEKIRPFIRDTAKILRRLRDEGKSILFEAQLGALRDLDFGIVPYTTSSNALAAYAQMFGPEAAALREAGAEYGAKTGRPRRVGPVDLVATRYGVKIQGATAIALTKLDVLSYMEKIPVCTAYEIDGERTEEFPFPVLLDRANPVVEYVDGWHCDISGARIWADLPEAARNYVERIERAVGCPIRYVSVGPERDAIIRR